MLHTHLSLLVIGLHSAAAAVAPTGDTTCGGSKGYTCNPNVIQGGACCSQYGYCGNTVEYCGTGCQSKYGYCSGVTPGAQANVPGVGHFNNFQAFNFAGTTMPQGLAVSDYTVDDRSSTPSAKYDHRFSPKNAVVSGGFLQLKVPGGQKPSSSTPATCAEIATTFGNIMYASVRTKAILTSEPGVVNGMFFYHDDCQEIDIEWLSDTSSLSNPGPGKAIPLQYTNQANDCNHDDDTYSPKPAPALATSAVHEYRIDWTPGRVDFYTDSKRTATFTTNVPTMAGNWIWNIWTNGDPGFSVGPPKKDAVLKISQIMMFYNTTSDWTAG